MDIGSVQRVRKFVLAFGVAVGVGVFAVTTSLSASGEKVHELIEWLGIILIVACILGRTWASLYISGRKNAELVAIGPYSVARNPLYFFSIVGAAGMGAQTGSVALAAICAALAGLVFHIVVRQEERLLLAKFGKRYRDYMAKVPRFLPKPSLWRDNPTLTIRPPGVLMTFADALPFLLAVPLAEGFEWLQETGIIPVLMVLP
jgi:protein-S-isoprenylcysteine O-methyltransferase Ste14